MNLQLKGLAVFLICCAFLVVSTGCGDDAYFEETLALYEDQDIAPPPQALQEEGLVPNEGDSKTIRMYNEEWMVGEETVTFTRSYQVNRATTLMVAAESESLCQGNGIQVKAVIKDQKTVVRVIDELPGLVNIELPNNAEVELTTAVTSVDPQIACVRLGNAVIQVTYQIND